MSDDFVKKALETAVETYTDLKTSHDLLKRQQEGVERQMGKLAIKIFSLARLCDDVPKGGHLDNLLKSISEMGLTETITAVMKASNEPLSASQVRDHIVRLGYNLTKYKNPIAAINTVLS